MSRGESKTPIHYQWDPYKDIRRGLNKLILTSSPRTTEFLPISQSLPMNKRLKKYYPKCLKCFQPKKNFNQRHSTFSLNPPFGFEKITQQNFLFLKTLNRREQLSFS